MTDKATEGLELRYVPLDDLALLDGNPKLHDIGAIASSIVENGFRDPPLWDSNLNKGQGGIVAGNGRTEALMMMRSQGHSPPKGIAVDAEGNWLVPVIFGCDARSEAAAKRFAIDHNNLVLSGGDFTAVDMMRVWDRESYVSLLEELAKTQDLPLTVDGDDLDLLLELAQNDAALTEEAVEQERKEIGTGGDTVGFTFGEIRFSVEKSRYLAWFDEMNIKHSYDLDKIIETIRSAINI